MHGKRTAGAATTGTATLTRVSFANGRQSRQAHMFQAPPFLHSCFPYSCPCALLPTAESPTMSPTGSPTWEDDGWQEDGWQEDGWPGDGWKDDGHKSKSLLRRTAVFVRDREYRVSALMPLPNPSHPVCTHAFYLTAKSPTMSPSLGPTFEPTDGDDVCMTYEQCDKQRRKMGFAHLYETDRFCGCFFKGENHAHWGGGCTREENAAEWNSNNAKKRIFCKASNWKDDGWEKVRRSHVSF